MKTVILKSNRHVELIEEEIPKAKDNLVVVKVHTSPMCTEFYHYRDGSRGLHAWVMRQQEKLLKLTILHS